MTDESISVEIKDGVDKGVARNINEIATAARVAYQNVDKLIRQINRVSPRAIQQFNSVVTNAQRQMQNAALSAEKLATQQARTATASAQAAAGQQRVTTAAAQADRAQTQAAAAALRLEAAQARSAATADRQAAAELRAAQAADAAARNLAANERELERVSGIHDRYEAVLARNPKYQQAFANNLAKTGKAAGLARYELINLGQQVNDVVVSLGSGQRPLTVLLQQGAQIGQIFGGSGAGAGAIFRQLAGIVGTLVARLLPFAAVLGAVLAPFQLFTREFNKDFDGEKFVKGLNLTEKQMERLKKSGEELRVTFGDTFKATFQVIGRYAEQYFKPVTDFIVKWWNIALDAITDFISFSVRLWLGQFLGLMNALKVAWNNLPGTIEFAVKTAINNTIGIVEFGVNAISNAIANSPLGKLLGVGGQTFELKLPRLELSDNAKDAGAQIAKGFADGFSTADKIVTQFGKDVKAQAIKNAQDRIKAAAGKRDKDGAGSGFDRAKELAAINAQLDAQAKHMFKLADAREAYNQVEEIALRFQKEGKPLTQTEIEALRTKIQALNDAKQVQQEFDRIYNNAVGPLKAYNAALEAADKLLKMGAISQAQYAAEVERAKKAHAESSVEGRVTAELDEQLKLLRLFPKEREIEQQVTQAVNEAILRGETLNVEKLREKLKLIQAVTDAVAIQDEMLRSSSANQLAQTQLQIDQIKALLANPEAQFGGGDAANATAGILQSMGISVEGMQLQSEAIVEQARLMYEQIGKLREANLISEQDAALARLQIWNKQHEAQLNQASSFFGNLATLQRSENKKIAAIGKAAAIAQAMIATYKSANEAYAAMAGIPYVGPALGVAAAAAAVAAGLANVAQIRSADTGFKQGGYTGDFGVNTKAGDVHGREFVMNAATTSRVGRSDLEALQRGAASVQRNGERAERANPNSAANVGKAAAAPAPVVNVPVTAIVVDSRQSAMAALQSSEGRAFIMETVEENGATVAKIAQGRS